MSICKIIIHKILSTPQKRLFEDLSSIEPSTAAVHCAIEVISPVKKAKSGVSYFDGMVTDGKRKFVSSDSMKEHRKNSLHFIRTKKQLNLTIA